MKTTIPTLTANKFPNISRLSRQAIILSLAPKKDTVLI